MNSLLVIALAVIAGLAVLGLGVKVALNWTGGKKVVQKNIIAGGDVTAGDKHSK
ncbi:hypothetical protein [Chromobacterium subtsugae]|uniref:hypothetical protein n=1 Tax=Chromobacterium subtsugae TaxID=251747 RepID=UPI001364AF79|nr:hypothetical protein [Chromobacterium subtsugae]